MRNHSAIRSRISTLLAMGAILASFAGVVHGSSNGPPDGFAGDPPDFLNCTTCHADFPLNSGDGELSLEGLPDRFRPRETYPLTIILQDEGQQRWGFELTVLDPDGNAAGTIGVVDPVNTSLSDNPGSEADYLKHTSEGTYSGDTGPAMWQFEWTPPDVVQVRFYLSGNAANGDFTSSGDFIYAIAIDLDYDSGSPVEATTWSAIKKLYAR